MKELTVEQKAQAYDEAIKRVKNIKTGKCKTTFVLTEGLFEHIFPELAESEDEKVNRILHSISIKMGSHLRDIFTEEEFQCFDAWYNDWSKRRCQVTEPTISQHEIKTCKENSNSLTCEDERIRKALIELVKCNERGGYKLLNNVPTSSMLSWLGKQGSQILANSAKTCKDEQKPADNVEPKFHEGEWLTENHPNSYARFVQILEIVNVQGKNRYRISRDLHNDEDIVECRFIEDNWHPFNIQDAKDGDVLASKDERDILIFRNLDSRTSFSSYYNIKGRLEIGWSNRSFIPATEEQRDLLFQKMKEAGYEWDAEKKELKKIPNALEEREIVHVEHGKCYYCIKDYYAGGNKRASKGDVVMALNGMSMMDLGVEANEYFIPVNNIELKPAEWSEEDEERIKNILSVLNVQGCWDGATGKKGNPYQKEIDWLKSLKDKIEG